MFDAFEILFHYGRLRIQAISKMHETRAAAAIRV